MTPSRDQLITAHRAADLAGSLDEALANPLLARCLAITATVIGITPSFSTPGRARSPAALAPRNHKYAAMRDFKRACAADKDD
ncbi:hypothetical protein D3C85_1719620 [compost metagenome]